MRRVLVALCATFATASCTTRGDSAYSGTLQAPSAAVGSTLGGRVVRVLVVEGSAVRAGQPLIAFDDAPSRAALESAMGRLAQARAARADLLAGPRPADLARAAALADQQRAQFESARSTQPFQIAILHDQLKQALAQAAQAKAAAGEAHADAGRMRELFATGDVSAQQRDAAVARERQTQAQVSGSGAAIRAVRAQSANAAAVTLPQSAASAYAAYAAARAEYTLLSAGPRVEQVHQAQANVRAALGDVRAARARLDESLIRAPADGVVTATDLHPGDLVAPGAAVATIEESGDPYVRIYLPQASLGTLKTGAALTVRADALPGRTLHGVVEQVDTTAQFTPQNVQTASDRAVLSFGVKVRVHDPGHELHRGTSVEVDAQ